MTHPGHELVFGLAGRCVYEVAGKEYRVGPGDSLLVDSRQPHRGRNPGRREARLLLVLYAPDEEPAWCSANPRLSETGQTGPDVADASAFGSSSGRGSTPI